MTSTRRTFHAEIFGGYGQCVSFQERSEEFKLPFENVGAMRYQNMSDQWIADIMTADARYHLWRSGSRIRRVDNPVRDAVPLRFWFPGSFVEPIRTRRCTEGNIARFRKLWRWAPFEIVFQAPPTPAIEYEFHVSRASLRNDNGSVSALTQICRRIRVLRSCFYSVRTRWFSLP